MLSQTKEQINILLEKIQIFEIALGALRENHKDYSDRVDVLYKTASNHKLKLVEELVRIGGASSVTEVKS